MGVCFIKGVFLGSPGQQLVSEQDSQMVCAHLFPCIHEPPTIISHLIVANVAHLRGWQNLNLAQAVQDTMCF